MVKEGAYFGVLGDNIWAVALITQYSVVSVTVKRNVRRFLELCRKANKDSRYTTDIYLFFLHVCSITWACKKLLSCSLVRRPQM